MKENIDKIRIIFYLNRKEEQKYKIISMEMNKFKVN